jgi:hypothetical protein
MSHETTDKAASIFLVFFTTSGRDCLDVYSTEEQAKRAVAHYKRQGHGNARIDNRAIRGETFLTMIGA